MPVWYERVKKWRDEGKIEMVGLIQEQHPARCALFLQWKQMDFPILVDALNRLGVTAVPLFWALDEHGVVRAVRPDFEWLEKEFLATDYPAPETPDMVWEDTPGVQAYLAEDWNAAVAELGKEATAEAEQGWAWFRLGCAYRARYDSPLRQAGDFQEAVRAWTRAIDLDPRNYIFRRRLQQYGPALDKPYPFYDWVGEARKAIRARGETPHALLAEPRGAELAAPAEELAAVGGGDEPDPGGKLPRDAEGLIAIEAVVAPAPLAMGAPARIALSLRPSETRDVHWNNETAPLQVWVELPEGWRSSHRLLTAAQPTDRAVSDEPRFLDLEIRAPEGQAVEEVVTLSAYAVYSVCEGEDGVCYSYRQDFAIPVPLRTP